MKRRLVSPVERLRLRAAASADMVRRVEERLVESRRAAAADAASYQAALTARAGRDAGRHMRGGR